MPEDEPEAEGGQKQAGADYPIQKIPSADELIPRDGLSPSEHQQALRCSR